MNAVKLRAWLYLVATVVLEVVATLCLKESDGFTVLVPSVVSLTAYAATVVALAFALREIPMSVAYVIWAGAGTAGVVLFGALIFDEAPTLASWIGVALVIAGVVMINARKKPARAEEGHATEEHA